MEITVLADNRAQDASLQTEHGLSVFVDTGTIKVLLDTGASDVFIHNAESLGIDLGDVDYIFISHAHNDHAGGLKHVLKINSKAQVICSAEAFNGSYYSSRKGMHSITPDWPCMSMQDRIISVDKETQIAGMRIIPNIRQNHSIPKANRCLYRCIEGDELIQDDFRHEMAIQVGDFLFTGCAHNGLMNILESSAFPARIVLGGFHLLDASAEEEFENDNELHEIAYSLRERYPDTIFYTGHCTGDKAYASMKQILGDNLQQFYSGITLHHP